MPGNSRAVHAAYLTDRDSVRGLYSEEGSSFEKILAETRSAGTTAELRERRGQERFD